MGDSKSVRILALVLFVVVGFLSASLAVKACDN